MLDLNENVSAVECLLNQIDWEKEEIVPVVVQENNTNQVLTLAYMNEKALKTTLETSYAHYYSRSKQRIRMKGEVSGNVQKVEKIKVDCDNDALLLIVNQKGPACHTGNKSCFYRELGKPKRKVGGIDYSLNVLKELEEIIRRRKQSLKKGSYTAKLFKSGQQEICKKLGEETIEALMAQEKEQKIYEVADILYHLLVFLRNSNIELTEVMNELRKRRRD